MKGCNLQKNGGEYRAGCQKYLLLNEFPALANQRNVLESFIVWLRIDNPKPQNPLAEKFLLSDRFLRGY